MDIQFCAREIREDNAIEYEHQPSNVIHLNTPHARAHARANAAQAAMTTEENRIAVRQDEIVARLEELHADRARIDVLIYDLEQEQERLRHG